jgi:hypothetical protein
VISKMAQLMASEEGFGIMGAIPTTHNNPGDLMHAPGEMHPIDAPNSIGSFATPQEGWNALQNQLQLFANRGLSVQEAVYTYAPPSANNSAAYLQFVCKGLGCTPDTPVSQALLIGAT